TDAPPGLSSNTVVRIEQMAESLAWNAEPLIGDCHLEHVFASVDCQLHHATERRVLPRVGEQIVHDLLHAVRVSRHEKITIRQVEANRARGILTHRGYCLDEQRS